MGRVIRKIATNGHGRLKTSHRPEQRSGETLKYTTYNYNPDDSILNITDGRGVVTNYIYNSRGLVEEMTWDVGETGVTDAHDVEFGYDALGNRTSMTDGLGTVAYEYDPLSRMTAETRVFSDTLPNKPTGNYRIGYEYTIGGGLQSYTDPYGDEIETSFDKLGRINAVTGSSYGGVTNYADNPAYRAWGALKHLEYGNDLNLNVTFNNRLAADTFEIKHPTDTDKKVFGKEYEYYSDGRLKYIKENFQDQEIKRFDRSFTYDHVGRTKDAKSGIEASGGTQTTLLLLPYRQTYSYSAFGMLTERQSTLWTEEGWGFQDTYVNNRRTEGWTYDNDGNTTYAAQINYEYDSAGKMIKTDRNEAYEMTVAHDGAGREAKRSQRKWDGEEDEWEAWETNYFVYSSVMGRTLTEVSQTGTKKRTFVVAAGTVMARQFVDDEQEEAVSWEYADASGHSIRMIAADGTPEGADKGGGELDALGNNVGTHGSLPRTAKSEYSPFDREPIAPEIMCNEDGIVGACSVVSIILGNEPDWVLRSGQIQSSYFSYWHSYPVEAGPRSHRRNRNHPGWIPYLINRDTGMHDLAFLYMSGEIDTRTPEQRVIHLDYLIGTQDQWRTPMTRDEVVNLWNAVDATVTGKCADFVEKLIRATGTEFTNLKLLLAEGLNRAWTTTGVSWKPGFGGFAYQRPVGHPQAHIAEILIGNQRQSSSAPAKMLDPIAALHEVIHVAARASDIDLSRAVQRLGLKVIGTDGKTEIKYPTDEDNSKRAYSGYWGQALINHCSETASLSKPTTTRR